MASEFDENDDNVEDILLRQDEAMVLLERLRAEEPFLPPRREPGGDGRRDFRRWPTPEGVALELHDGEQWHPTEIVDMGLGGVCVHRLPSWVKGPVPARLKAPGISAVLTLADVMWRDKGADKAGLRFEFLDEEDREQWSGGLIDALLARYAVG